ncbi:hypothetical protein [Paenibacillus sp. sgz5001063]|uniref:hypothetical protein n=1 Tax=Paenibacillus sp. sgz5001063 TaxID=3242474 RepID=UPI0036D43ACB
MLFKYSKEESSEHFYCFTHDKGGHYWVEKSFYCEVPDETETYDLISDAPGHKKIEEILKGEYLIRPISGDTDGTARMSRNC